MRTMSANYKDTDFLWKQHLHKMLEMFKAFETFLVVENLKIFVENYIISAWIDERHFKLFIQSHICTSPNLRVLADIVWCTLVNICCVVLESKKLKEKKNPERSWFIFRSIYALNPVNNLLSLFFFFFRLLLISSKVFLTIHLFHIIYLFHFSDNLIQSNSPLRSLFKETNDGKLSPLSLPF